MAALFAHRADWPPGYWGEARQAVVADIHLPPNEAGSGPVRSLLISIIKMKTAIAAWLLRHRRPSWLDSYRSASTEPYINTRQKLSRRTGV